MLISFEEFSCPDSGVLIGNLGYHNGVISAEEANDELSVIVVFNFTDKSGFESQDILVIRKDFLDIFFGGFGVKGEN